MILLLARYSSRDAVRKKVGSVLGEKSLEQLPGIVSFDAPDGQAGECLRFLEKRLEKAK